MRGIEGEGTDERREEDVEARGFARRNAMDVRHGRPRRDTRAPLLTRDLLPHGWDPWKPLYAATVPGWALQHRCERRVPSGKER